MEQGLKKIGDLIPSKSDMQKSKAFPLPVPSGLPKTSEIIGLVSQAKTHQKLTGMLHGESGSELPRTTASVLMALENPAALAQCDPKQVDAATDHLFKLLGICSPKPKHQDRIDPRYGFDFDLVGFHFFGLTDDKTSEAKHIVAATLQPAPKQICTKAATILKARTKARAEEYDDLKIIMGVLVEDLMEYPADVVIDAAQTMGDHKRLLSAIAMHSVVYTSLQKLNLITYIPNSRGEVNIPTYLGYTVVVDDSMPAVAGTNRITYTSILFSAGAFGMGNNTQIVPSELDRLPAAGHGGGQDILYSRQGGIIHPRGITVTGTPASTRSFTLAELAAAATWNRVYDRKKIGIAFLQTNG